MGKVTPFCRADKLHKTDVPETTKEAVANAQQKAVDQIRGFYDSLGVTDQALSRAGKKFLKQRKTLMLKVKGGVSLEEAKKEIRATILKARGLLLGKEKRRLNASFKVVYRTAEETLIAVEVEDTYIMLEAWREINRMKGNYPEQALKLTGNVTLDVEIQQARGKLADKIAAIADRRGKAGGDQ